MFCPENQLSGSIPNSFGNLSNLGWLELHDNQLTGTIPSGIRGLAGVGILTLYGNQFSTGTAVDATALTLTGDRLLLQRHDDPDAYVELGIGWISKDGSEQVVVSFLRDEQLGSVYIIVRHESDGAHRPPLGAA